MRLFSQNILLYIVRAIVLLTAMPVHECAHGYMAYRLGDDTARSQGRLTLNPFRHLDLVGSILLIFVGFGWAKPVPVDSRRFKNPKRDMALTALAGPLSNILMAFAVMVLGQVLTGMLPAYRYSSNFLFSLSQIFDIIILVNIQLAVFNLLPVPPLDGSKIFASILPNRYYYTVLQYERQISLILMVLLFTGALSKPLSYLSVGLYWLLDKLTLPISLLFR